MALGHVIHFPIKTTDVAIQVDKLLRTDDTRVQRGQTVLHADIIQGSLRN